MKKNFQQYSIQHVTPITNHITYRGYLSSGLETKFVHGRTRTIIHASIKPKQKTLRLKRINKVNNTNKSDFHSNSNYQVKSLDSFLTHSSQFNENSWTQPSLTQVNAFTSSSIFHNNGQTSKTFNNSHSNTKDLLEYSGKKKRRDRLIISLRRCLWILLCLCLTLLLGIILAVVLIATLIKPNSTTTTTTEVTTGLTSTVVPTTTATTTTITTYTTSVSTTSISSSVTTSITTESTTITTTQSTIVSTAETMSTTTVTVASASITNITSYTTNYYGYEMLFISCSVSLTNVTIQIFVETTVGATYDNMYNSFSSGVITESNTTTASQIIYTWTISSGQTVNCASPTYSVKAQFDLTGTAQITSADTYIITTATSSGVTTVFTGNF